MVKLPFNQKIFGLGLGRTGTASLSAALNQLGIKTRHFLDYNLHLQDFKVDEKVFCGDRLFAMLNQFQGIANGSGLPFRELDLRYPGSKFILTIREKSAWLESKRRYAEIEFQDWPRFDLETRRSKRFIRENIYGTFDFDERSWLEAYERRVKGVLYYFKHRAEDLLVMDIPGGDGWDKLCFFLGLPVPSVPFPHENSLRAVAEWNERVTAVRTDIENFIPSDHVFVLVDECKLGYSNPRALPFLERDGHYWGRPANDPQAVDELDRMRRAGADFIVFVWATFWWLEYYAEFNRYLRSKFRCVVENDRLVIFDIRSSITSATA